MKFIKTNHIWIFTLIIIIILYGCNTTPIHKEDIKLIPSDKSFVNLVNYLYLDSTAIDSSEVLKVLEDSVVSFSADDAVLELVTSIYEEKEEHSHIFIKTKYYWPHIWSRLFFDVFINKNDVIVEGSKINTDDIFPIGYKYYYEPDSSIINKVFRLEDLDSLGTEYSSGVGAFFYVKIDSSYSHQKVNWSLLFESLYKINNILDKRRSEFSQKLWKSDYIDLPFYRKLIIDNIVPSKIFIRFELD